MMRKAPQPKGGGGHHNPKKHKKKHKTIHESKTTEQQKNTKANENCVKKKHPNPKWRNKEKHKQQNGNTNTHKQNQIMDKKEKSGRRYNVLTKSPITKYAPRNDRTNRRRTNQTVQLLPKINQTQQKAMSQSPQKTQTIKTSEKIVRGVCVCEVWCLHLLFHCLPSFSSVFLLVVPCKLRAHRV